MQTFAMGNADIRYGKRRHSLAINKIFLLGHKPPYKQVYF